MKHTYTELILLQENRNHAYHDNNTDKMRISSFT